MTRIFSNGIARDFVLTPFEQLLSSSSRIHLAAPYFTESKQILEAARGGKSIQLLIGLNAATSPKALADVLGVPNLSVRYLTHRFHAKIFLFDHVALLGSSNLTDGGMLSNREAVILLDRPEDSDEVEDIRALFQDLWSYGEVLTPDILRRFKQARDAIKGLSPDAIIENAIGRVEPRNIDVASHAKSPQRVFLEEIRRSIQEYQASFNEVTAVLEEHNYRRAELKDLGSMSETNRFLNWVRLTYAKGDESWRQAEVRGAQERKQEVKRLGEEWKTTQDPKIPEPYVAMVMTVRRVLASRKSIETASQQEIMDALLSTHAFLEQQRFVKGGLVNLSNAFWTENPDIQKVKRTLFYLVHETGDFAERLHDVLYRSDLKVKKFARFCALELYGTIKPRECPPTNGRMAKALKFLGYDVNPT